MVPRPEGNVLAVASRRNEVEIVRIARPNLDMKNSTEIILEPYEVVAYTHSNTWYQYKVFT